MNSTVGKQLTAHPGHSLRGDIAVPGDKSISHRAVILGSLAIGTTEISGLLEGEDVLATIRAARQFGAVANRSDEGTWTIDGFGTGGFSSPDDVIDCGNSGTGARLLMGAVATSPIVAVFTGDSSLRSRPMGRVLDPISEFGAQCIAREGRYLPATIIGSDCPVPARIELSVPSAQVKSAILLAGLNAPGRTVVTETARTRDHTENMMALFGATVAVEDTNHAQNISVEGHAELVPQPLTVPGDPSSAAFPVTAAILTGGSQVTIRGVCINPTRTGLFTTLQEMGANLRFENRRSDCGEEVADVKAGFSVLEGIEIPPERAPTMIDEYPILAVAAAFAEGRTVMRGVRELRYKESDRLYAVARGLEACGVRVEEKEDELVVIGNGPGGVEGGATCRSFMDHRIAMSFLCLGLATRSPVTVDDSGSIATSFPQFASLMASIGSEIR